MKMKSELWKPLIAAALSMAFLTGCSFNDSPVRILGTRPLAVVDDDATECDTLELQILGGSLDISAQTAYVLQLDMESDLQAINTSSGGAVIADGSRNNFYGEEIYFEYTSTPTLTFEQEAVPIHFVVQPQSEAAVRLDLLSAKAAQVLRNAVLPGDTVELLVNLEIRGALASGQELRTNRIRYPITIFNTGFSGCGAGTILRRNGPCGLTGGQDGAPAVCCPTDPADPSRCAE